MIHYLNGEITELTPTSAIVECAGVGYFVNISVLTSEVLQGKKAVKLLTSQIIRDDAHLLFGFHNSDERICFHLLTSVSGVGVNTARMILSTLTPSDVKEAVLSDAVTVFSKVKGIGAKTAQRIIVDLRDKVLKLDLDITNSSVVNNRSKIEALSALEVLGFSTKVAGKALDIILKKDPELSVEILIKEALKRL